MIHVLGKENSDARVGAFPVADFYSKKFLSAPLQIAHVLKTSSPLRPSPILKIPSKV